MVRAIWNGAELAKSEKTIVVEGNQYFPREDVVPLFLQNSNLHTRCPWKGLASYYHLVVDGQKNENAAWYYPEPSEKAAMIKNHIAFGNGVVIQID